MTILLILLMLITFLALDYAVRKAIHHLQENHARRKREEVLHTAVRLDFSHEARSLKRVQVEMPKARILAVDDEAVVLDAFRRILVLEGYSVDTVEKGPEALGLLHRNDYEFLFTDLKMPDMDGVEVVKAARQLRPDVDVVVITGYGTIETAVQSLQFGACEYVQKPFTAEELAEFVARLLIKREARQDAQRQPVVHLVSPAKAARLPAGDYHVPGGAFLSQGHTWARIEETGLVRIGLDDFLRKAMGETEEVLLPPLEREVRRGETLCTFKRGSGTLSLRAPVSGRVVRVNPELTARPARVTESPYAWLCQVEPRELTTDLATLRIGRPAVEWLQAEITRSRKTGPLDWPRLEQEFLQG